MRSLVTRALAHGVLPLLAISGCSRAELETTLGRCPDGATLCVDACVDLQSDESDCGACGHACLTGETCLEGRCRSPECGALSSCDGGCVDFASDSENCGGCQVRCGEGSRCRAGRCAVVEGCDSPAVACAGECVDTESDPAHCGGCFAACPEGWTCRAGSCVLVCAPGLSACGNDCVDLGFDADNCGGCEQPCASNQMCQDGLCVESVCPPGQVVCGTECVDLDSNPNHCGACFATCDSSATCSRGRCICPELEVACGDQCVFVNTDPAHCGACDRACASGEDCVMGSCVPGCSGALEACGDACVNLASDTNHCGDCDVACGASERCVEGACVAACDWDLGVFPIAIDSGTSVGDLTLDLNCNLYVGKQPGAVLRVDFESHEVSPLVTFSGYVRGIVFRPEDGRLYLSSQDRLQRMDVDGSNLVELENTNVGQYLNGMTLAPAGWGEFGGDLIVARSDGLVIAIDPDEPLPTVIAQVEPFISDVEFDGQTLYVASFTEQLIREVDPDGQVTVFAQAPCEPDGLSVAPGNDLFVACGNANEVYAYSFSEATWNPIAEAQLNGLWAPSGLLWDGTDTLIVLEETLNPEGSLLRGYDPF